MRYVYWRSKNLFDIDLKFVFIYTYNLLVYLSRKTLPLSPNSAITVDLKSMLFFLSHQGPNFTFLYGRIFSNNICSFYSSSLIDGGSYFMILNLSNKAAHCSKSEKASSLKG